jgi:hypothetical protein
MTTPSGERCTAATIGIIQDRPTEAYRAELISKETRNLDRAGITEDPAYTSLVEPFSAAWKEHFLPAIRRLAPDVLSPGRVSRDRQRTLSEYAGKLAREALADVLGATANNLPAEEACYLYLQRTPNPPTPSNRPSSIDDAHIRALMWDARSGA